MAKNEIRQLDLWEYLARSRAPRTRSEIWESIRWYRDELQAGKAEQSVRRKFARDLKTLRAIGVNVQVDQDAYHVFEPELRPLGETVGADPEYVGQHVVNLWKAITKRIPVQFRYRTATGRESDRRFRPYGLLMKLSRWYVVGHDENRQALREFLVRRISGLQLVGEDAPFEAPEEFSLHPWVVADAWNLPGEGDPDEVLCRFDAVQGLLARQQSFGEDVEALDSGDQIRAFQVRQPSHFRASLLSRFREHAEVMEPANHREQVRHSLERIVQAHGEPRG
jgi:predicted DNA-binding transcriptional regulator YafY